LRHFNFYRVYLETDGPTIKKLYITDIQDGDKGTYTCSSSVGVTTETKTVTLQLFSKTTSVVSLIISGFSHDCKGTLYQEHYMRRSAPPNVRVDRIAEDLEDCGQETPVVMHCDSHIRDMFKQCYRIKIWAKAFTEEHYKSLATKAMKELVSLHSSYLCEQSFPR